jgi:RHS repeat-associated protein
MHVDYAYDVFGNRLAKSVRTGSFGSPVVTRFAYDDQGNLWADLNVNENLLTRYIGGDQTDHLFARISSGGAVAWYLPDHLGSVRDLTDNTGTVQDHIDYDAFGNVTFETSLSFGDCYKYTGRESDVETGLQYNRARYYDPKIGRWMAKDPIGFDAGDANLYRYVGNDPTNRVDPSGRSDRPDKSNTLIYAKNGDGTYNVEYPDGHGETKNTNGQDIKEFLRTLYPHLNVMSRDEWNQAFGKQLEPFGAVAVKTDFQHIPRKVRPVRASSSAATTTTWFSARTLSGPQRPVAEALASWLVSRAKDYELRTTSSSTSKRGLSKTGKAS